MTTIEVGERSYVVCVPHAATDYIQSNLVKTGRPYEEQMLEAMAAALEPGDLVVDVGANIGNHTLYLAVVGDLQVVAYEPNPELVAGIRASVEANDLGDRVVVRDVGVHSKSARGTMADLDATNLGAQSVAVADEEGDFAVVALDDEQFPARVAALKIDVEGAEIDVLEGAAALIARDRPIVYAECGTLTGYQKVSSWMIRMGYAQTGTYNLTPTHVFRPATGLLEEAEVVAALVTATEEIYRLNSLKVALRAQIAEQDAGSGSA
ncbi:FkbM family methyltransferase [Nocardioides luteus]|uniref:FkbM family methyltransferase n=1 Tax=Nocardioides luteus TaxID=1844 RepID=UPI0018C92982|nr:FkbM family methyltransferase [Nocardioides luteus]MBG6097568.1 FkbM family methyltransferase [Nocardioides luteus]